MKILLIDDCSHVGSTGKITYGAYNHYKSRGNDVLLCYDGGREEIIKDDPHIIALNNIVESYYSIVMTRLIGYEGLFNRNATRKLIKIVEDFQPDIVQIITLHSYFLNHYKFLEYLKSRNQKTVYLMVDQFPYMGKCCFATGCEKYKTECKDCPQVKEYPKSLFFDWSNEIFHRKQRIYEGFNNLIFVGTKWCVEQAKESVLLKNASTVIMDYPLDMETFQPRNVSNLKKELNIPENNKVVITVARASFPLKGGRFFIDLARKLQEHKNITFVYVGYDVDDWDIPENVKTIGFVKSQYELSEFFSLGDISVNTSLADLTPLACLEALACGTPLAGFAEVGVPDSASPDFGTFVRTYDVDALAEVILNAPIKNNERIKSVREYARNRYSSSYIYDKYLELYSTFDNFIK